MSVFKRPGSPYYHYEFQVQGARFRGSTGETSKGKALQAEAKQRGEIEGGARTGRPQRQMTLGEASSRFWLEKGQHEKNADSVFYQLENLVDGLGKNSLLSAISMSDLAEYQARRRGQKTRRGTLPANRTVNAECPELIARIFRRAESLWSDEKHPLDLGPAKDWVKLKLRVPKGRVRELSADEETRLFAALRQDYHEIVEFAVITGLRRAALLLKWSQVDLAAGIITYDRKSLSEEDIGTLPISQRMRQILVAQRGRHRTAVFTYQCKRTRDGREKGRRYPITEEGLRTTLQRAVRKAKIKDWRIVHDLRHTAASRVLRTSQNLALVQKLLGHADIASTVRYAHVMNEDVAAALDATTPHKIPTLVETAKPKRAAKR